MGYTHPQGACSGHSGLEASIKISNPGTQGECLCPTHCVGMVPALAFQLWVHPSLAREKDRVRAAMAPKGTGPPFFFAAALWATRPHGLCSLRLYQASA